MSYDLPWEATTGKRASCITDHAPFDAYLHGGPASHVKLAAERCRAICETCPVFAECRRDVLRDEAGQGRDTREGYIAGMTPRQRWALDQEAS